MFTTGAYCFADSCVKIISELCLGKTMRREADKFRFLLSSEKLTKSEKERYQALISMNNGQYIMDEKNLSSSLRVLSELLCKHYDQKTIILIDEYDVPLDKAFQHGYYREMVSISHQVQLPLILMLYAACCPRVKERVHMDCVH